MYYAPEPGLLQVNAVNNLLLDGTPHPGAINFYSLCCSLLTTLEDFIKAMTDDEQQR